MDSRAPRAHAVPWLDLLLLLAASRAALLVVGILSSSLLASGLSLQKGNLVFHPPAPLPVEIWSRWDSEWYLLIAEEGYAGPAVRRHFEGLGVPYEPEATAGFFPLYPLLIRALSPLLGGPGAGVLISNGCLWGAMALLYLLAFECAGGGGPGRAAGLAACAALLVHPMSLFLSAVYAESLFLALSLGAVVASRRGRFGTASAAAALAALTRPFGVLLAAPLLLEWWGRQDASGRRRSARSLLPILAIPAAPGLFAIHCARVFGDPLAFAHRQARWRGALSGPWRAFSRWWEAGPAPHGAHDSTLELAIAAVFVLTIPFLFRRLGLPLAVYGSLTVLLPLCSTLWSFGRLSLAVFPAFVLAGVAWSAGSRRLMVAYGFAGSALSAFLMALFASWWWAG